MPERFSGELLTMGRDTNPASFYLYLFSSVKMLDPTRSLSDNCVCVIRLMKIQKLFGMMLIPMLIWFVFVFPIQFFEATKYKVLQNKI